MNDRDKYQQALWAQKFVKNVDKMPADTPKPFGAPDEKCPRCGGPIETLLDRNGRNPWRRCWQCTEGDEGQ